MTAELEPLVEFPVMSEEAEFAVGVNHPRGGRDVSDGEGSFEAPGIPDDEIAQPGANLSFLRVSGDVLFEEPCERVSRIGQGKPGH